MISSARNYLLVGLVFFYGSEICSEPLFPLIKQNSSVDNDNNNSTQIINNSKSDYTDDELLQLYLMSNNFYKKGNYNQVIENCIVILKHSKSTSLRKETDELMQKAMSQHMEERKSSPKITSLSGPRMGILYLGGEEYAKLVDSQAITKPVSSLFGWQFETRYFSVETGASGIVEFIPFLAGIEQGMMFWNVNMLVGVRSASGLEFTMGPGVYSDGDSKYLGTNIAVAFGKNIRSGGLNIPLNFYFSYGRYALRFGFTFGFNTKTN